MSPLKAHESERVLHAGRLLTEKQIRRGAHRSTRELEAAIKRYLALTNDAPKPFVWTKTADEILESVASFCRRTSGSGH